MASLRRLQHLCVGVSAVASDGDLGCSHPCHCGRVSVRSALKSAVIRSAIAAESLIPSRRRHVKDSIPACHAGDPGSIHGHGAMSKIASGLAIGRRSKSKPKLIASIRIYFLVVRALNNTNFRNCQLPWFWGFSCFIGHGTTTATSAVRSRGSKSKSIKYH